MSHRKVHSNGYGSIPFSWEDKPGVPKTPNLDYSNFIGPVKAISQKSSSTLPPSPTCKLLDSSRSIPAIEDMKIPLPLPPCISSSWKGFRWQEDPFLVAYKECTKPEKINKLPSQNKKVVGSKYRLRKSRSMFSCKSSTDVRDDNFLKLSQLSCLPIDKNPSFT